MKKDSPNISQIDDLKENPISSELDDTFKSVIQDDPIMQTASAAVSDPNEISLVRELDLDVDLGNEDAGLNSATKDDGFELSLNEDENLDLAEGDYSVDENADSDYGDLPLDEDNLELSEEDLLEEEAPTEGLENIGELSFDDVELPDANMIPDMSLSEEAAPDEELKLDAEDGLTLSEELNLSNSSSVKSMDLEFSDDAMKKLEEIDAIMVEDASRVNIPPINLKNELLEQDDALNIDLSGDDKLNLSSESGSLELNLSEEESVVNAPLVKEDMNLDGLNFSSEEEESVPEEKPKKKKKEVTEEREHRGANLSEDLRQISGAYSGEMERLQATMSNLRTDREELLTKIQKLEDDKVMQNRQSLTMRAELDEKKIELTIIRKKLNEEISDLKDKLKLHDEKRLIIEEKNRILMQELDKSAQRNKIDVKKIQMREKELEQKLELLKADAETQIRNRDLKILELKRRLDSMEFDMESLSQQEKKSVESRFELEDKLEKAIKTLRTAINVLEDENERSGALSALKKNLDV
jgi:hypothetical protein